MAGEMRVEWHAGYMPPTGDFGRKYMRSGDRSCAVQFAASRVVVGIPLESGMGSQRGSCDRAAEERARSGSDLRYGFMGGCGEGIPERVAAADGICIYGGAERQRMAGGAGGGCVLCGCAAAGRATSVLTFKSRLALVE